MNARAIVNLPASNQALLAVAKLLISAGLSIARYIRTEEDKRQVWLIHEKSCYVAAGRKGLTIVPTYL